jgi:hypothetical protein
MTWHQQANCLGANPETFFPERGDHAGVRAALAICAGCTVVEQCLDESIELKDGIIGGTTGAQRRKIRSERGVNRQCLHCGHGFKAYSVQKFCSDECKKARHHEQKTESALRAWWSE